MECVATQLKPVYKQQSIKQVENYNQKPVIDLNRIDLNNLNDELAQAKGDFEADWDFNYKNKNIDFKKNDGANLKKLQSYIEDNYNNEEKYVAIKTCYQKLFEEKKYIDLQLICNFFENEYNVKSPYKFK